MIEVSYVDPFSPSCCRVSSVGRFLAATTHSARTAFDGNWSVLIVTDAGQCDRAYRYGLVIRDGRVLYEGEAAVNVAGNVTRNGAVSVRVSAGSQHADGAGRLSNSNGSGKWSGTGSAGSCSGTWSAERR